MAGYKKPFSVRAFEATGLTQKGMAQTLGIGLRTVQRWSGTSVPGVWHADHYKALAKASVAKDREFAEECARTAGTTLVDLGLVPRPKPPAPAPPPPPKPRITAAQADAIVCAVAEAKNVPPGEVRSLIATAFARALELGYSVEMVAEALTPSLPKAPPSKTKPAS